MNPWVQCVPNLVSSPLILKEQRHFGMSKKKTTKVTNLRPVFNVEEMPEATDLGHPEQGRCSSPACQMKNSSDDFRNASITTELVKVFLLQYAFSPFIF